MAERGIDPREYTLVAFGGAGPLHAGLLLREAGLGGVLVPRYPGLFAAAGPVSGMVDRYSYAFVAGLHWRIFATRLYCTSAPLRATFWRDHH